MSKKQHREFIATSIDNIRKAHNENYLSVFAGAGISANSDLPEWRDLINELKKLLYGNVEKNEDYLVLAEKFYNQFGENFYYQTLKSLIPDNAKTKNLHLEIVSLNIKNLITTNWDNLFEQAINEEGRFFNIIKSDADIGSSTGFAKFIKMHGSLDKNNIVFKEQDYLEYSKNFPLIENYIKGVFSTDTIILLGYSLNDQNVKQIISWVNSCSKGVKPIYFIKTAKEFDGIEFEFYKNKNIHILYTQELFGKKGHFEELSDFIKEIKNKPNKTLKIHNGIINSSRKIRKMIFEFDYKAMRKRIDEISLNSSSILDELEKAFLLYQLGQSIQAFETLRKLSKQAFLERDYKIWFISLYNMSKMPLPYNFDGSKDKITRFHQERREIDLDDCLYKLPVHNRQGLKYLKKIDIELKNNLINAYDLKDKISQDFQRCKSGGGLFDFNNYAYQSYKVFSKFILKNIKFLILDDTDGFFQQMIDIWFSTIGIIQIKQEKIQNKTPLEVTLNHTFFYCIIKYSNESKLKSLLDQYFVNHKVTIALEEKVNLIKILENIFFDCSRNGINSIFNNVLLLMAWIKLEQDAFDYIIKYYGSIITPENYNILDYFISTQFENYSTSINFTCLQDILSSFIHKPIGNVYGSSQILKLTPFFRNLLNILKSKNIKLNTRLVETTKILVEVLKTSPITAQNDVVCDLLIPLYLVTEKQDECHKTLKDFFLDTWKKNKMQKSIINNWKYLRITRELWKIQILNIRQYQNIYLKMKMEYENINGLNMRIPSSHMEINAEAKMKRLLEECREDFLSK